MTEDLLALLLDTYTGPFAIASFDPFIFRWFRKNRPVWTRVQITGSMKRHAVGRLWRFSVKNHLVLLISRPDTLACEMANVGRRTRLIARLFGLPVIAWTVRDPATARAWEGSVATIIFEGFLY